ncbi:MAG: hypothetical protein IJZ50_01245 [Alistipes sp.]|nr:hypothetical protein [Alistipes sp.]MBQ8774460.1 hypothetical protein [Alistipes sp.]
MNWQDIVVAIICVAVILAALHRIWRFFRCRDKSRCSSCSKECGMRRRE